MTSIALKSDRIKRIDITDNGKVLGQAVFNPYDMAVYKKYVGIRKQLAQDERAFRQLAEEYEALPKDVPDEQLLVSREYEKLDRIYQTEEKLGESVNNIFNNLRNGVDSIFGEGVYDLLTQGYHDADMLGPLFEAAAPFFEEAGKERNSRVEAAKLNRKRTET